MTNSVDPDQFASRSQLIYINAVCKGWAYSGLAGQWLRNSVHFQRGGGASRSNSFGLLSEKGLP